MAQREREHLRSALHVDNGVSHFFQALTDTKQEANGRELLWNGVRTKICLVRCCEGPQDPGPTPPIMTPPPGPPPEASLGSMSGLVGFAPTVPCRPDAALPPWHGRLASITKTRASACPWRTGDAGQRVQLRRGPTGTRKTNASPSGAPSASGCGRANSPVAAKELPWRSGGGAARLVGRPPGLSREPPVVPTPPPPPPRTVVYCSDSMLGNDACGPRQDPACDNDLEVRPVMERRGRRYKKRVAHSRGQEDERSHRGSHW